MEPAELPDGREYEKLSVGPPSGETGNRMSRTPHGGKTSYAAFCHIPDNVSIGSLKEWDSSRAFPKA